MTEQQGGGHSPGPPCFLLSKSIAYTGVEGSQICIESYAGAFWYGISRIDARGRVVKKIHT